MDDSAYLVCDNTGIQRLASSLDDLDLSDGEFAVCIQVSAVILSGDFASGKPTEVRTKAGHIVYNPDSDS